MAADKAYDFRANREHLRRRGITAVIPEKADQKAVTRYDKLPERYQGGIELVSALI